LARTVGRGGTSGIGIAAFENGGFILDAGHRASEKKGFSPSRFSRASPPTALLRYEVPRDWKFLCVLPETRGAHGKTEMDIFKRYCPIPKAEVGEVSRIVLMNVLPGVAERDIEEFGSGINRLQKTGFKRVEVSLQGEPVKELLGFLKDNSYGAGMSSFGPLCFGLFDKKGDSKSVGREAKELLAQTGLDSGVFLAGADNKGARIS
ncbi:MAG: beta-ribofuranosylaminobenzene 5'-phosphate synthase, partial [Candidatus Altiarchaeota archaeon]|nr:beta-ribofuranosylaminobenzene 5'-phosphate synthase [Candidatus Altiarchaeota archaeon]